MQLSKPIWFQGWVKQFKQLIICKGKRTCTDSFHGKVEEGCYSNFMFRGLLQPKCSGLLSSMPMWQSEFLCTDFIMDSFSKSTHLVADILLPSLSLPFLLFPLPLSPPLPPLSPPSLPPFHIPVLFSWDRISSPSPDWTQVCADLPASSSPLLGL